MKSALESLEANHQLKGLVFDLRGNPGGLLNEAINVANVFVDKNVLMLGFALEGGKARVALSDGRWVTREDGLTRLTPTYCVVQGRVYRSRSLEEQRREEERVPSRGRSERKQGLPSAN